MRNDTFPCVCRLFGLRGHSAHGNHGATFREGVSSGTPQQTKPGAFGAGTIRAGAIELSNTDIGRSLVDLIVASTNYRGNARVISSVQQLVDELLVLGR
jgi:flagellar hook protein FlgE